MYAQLNYQEMKLKLNGLLKLKTIILTKIFGPTVSIHYKTKQLHFMIMMNNKTSKLRIIIKNVCEHQFPLLQRYKFTIKLLDSYVRCGDNLQIQTLGVNAILLCYLLE